jgi:hypothetical protein
MKKKAYAPDISTGFRIILHSPELQVEGGEKVAETVRRSCRELENDGMR